MIYPLFIYRYERPINPRTGKPGTRYNLVEWKGPGCYHVLGKLRLKSTQEPVVYVNRWKEKRGIVNSRKGKLILAAPGSRCLTSLFEPEPEAPGKGYGDLSIDGERPGRDAILSIRDDKAGVLELAIFKDLGPQSETLFFSWLDGGVVWAVRPKPRVYSI